MKSNSLTGIVSAEYPYYRDQPENWRKKLEKIQDAGIEVISFYIPWRHHEPEQGTYDFNGSSQENRDLVGFLQLCKELGLKAIVKPGPFIHAETNNAGLPDWQVVDKNPDLEARTDSRDNPITWKRGKNPDGSPYRAQLPTPLDKQASQNMVDWLTNVKETIKPFTDVIIGLQLFNEWYESDCQHVIQHTDYSKSAQSLFLQKYLKEKYGAEFDTSKLSAPREFSAKSLDDLRLRLDWADFSVRHYMEELYTRFNVFKETGIPIIQNPKCQQVDRRDFSFYEGNLKEVTEARKNRRWDSWLARISQLPKWDLLYAPTSWIGLPSDEADARVGLELALRAGEDPFLSEDNWAYSEEHRPLFASARVVAWQTIFGIANGMKGTNIYTAVQTENHDDHLDRAYQVGDRTRFPRTPPIDAEGNTNEKYEALTSLVDLVKTHDLFNAEPAKRQVAWGNYGPYAQMAMWNEDDANWVKTFEKLGHQPIRAGYKGLDNFARQLGRERIDYDIANLETAELDREQTPVLTLVSGFYMDEDTQQKLADYATKGGKLVLYGELPTVDEKFEPCDILKRAAESTDNIINKEGENAFRSQYSTKFIQALRELGVKPGVESNNPELYVRELVHPEGKRYVFILSTSTEEQKGEVTVGNDRIRVSLAPRVAEVYSIADGNVDRIFTTANYS